MKSTANTSTAGRFASRRRGLPDWDHILKLRAQGISVQNISQMVGCSMADVHRLLQPDPSKDNPTTPPGEQTPDDRRQARDERFRALWLAEVPRDEICHALGIGASTLDNDRRRLGLPGRVRGRKPKEAGK